MLGIYFMQEGIEVFLFPLHIRREKKGKKAFGKVFGTCISICSSDRLFLFISVSTVIHLEALD